MNKVQQYDSCIIGGGLAGLALSIQLAKLGYKVAVFEKETYPFHKVCGEYISLESWNFIQKLGYPLSDAGLPIIKKLLVSAPNGNMLQHSLPLGGFGISRYKLDNGLKEIAVLNNVQVFENCKVNDVDFNNDFFRLQTTAGQFNCRICCGSYGKRSNLDVKWNRPFISSKPNKLDNFIAVKYHISINHPHDTIALHNFKDGYCGISKIEDNRYCLCYLTNAQNLKNCNNSIRQMEKEILYKNPHLKKIFTGCRFLYQSPVTISQISFNKKSQVENHVLLIGDAAGMITSLCGNGMSMALHGSKIAALLVDDFLKNKISRQQLETKYTMAWKKNFENRLRYGRRIQLLFGKTWVTNFFVAILKKLPFLTKSLIRQTHGQPF
ncbi:MAG: NAD(P)/FAD-dependent oxidoreductase [Ferruginibacter sp.]|nr:NAD(P)/FAD-dependent oxidoreductase [Ferruginibacter sp.]